MKLKFIYFLSLFKLVYSWSFKNRFRLRTIAGSPYPMKTDRIRYFIDIDGTICSITNSDYTQTKPNYEKIRIFNELYLRGDEIHYWTGRGSLSGKNWDKYTKQQLESWGVLYTSINTGKPHYDIWIDDKAINVKDI